MTENKLQKRAIRERMEKTDEKYTAARRALLDVAAGPPSHELHQLLRRPGTIVAVVNGGGGMNLALALPAIARHLDEGGHLVFSPYGDDFLGIPSAPDFAIARGVATLAEIETWIEGKDKENIGRAITEAAPGAQVLNGPSTPESLAEALELRPDPLLYVQDIQTDPPLRQPNPGRRLSEFDLVPENVQAIRPVIDKVEGRAIVGHCMPADDIESWESLSEVADYTLAIHDDYRSRSETNPNLTEATIEVFDSAGPLDSYKTTIDHAFLHWRRSAYSN
jgi:hypothetical protein